MVRRRRESDSHRGIHWGVSSFRRATGWQSVGGRSEAGTLHFGALVKRDHTWPATKGQRLDSAMLHSARRPTGRGCESNRGNRWSHRRAASAPLPRNPSRLGDQATTGLLQQVANLRRRKAVGVRFAGSPLYGGRARVGRSDCESDREGSLPSGDPSRGADHPVDLLNRQALFDSGAGNFTEGLAELETAPAWKAVDRKTCAFESRPFRWENL